MTKRNGKGNRRTLSPDSMAKSSSKTREKSSRSPSPNRGSESSNRGAIHQSVHSKPASRSFEVSDSPDNIHSPFHLHSSDHPGLVLAPELLDGSNYGTWIIAISTSLEAKNKFGFVDGSIVKPDDNDPYCKIWKRCNSMVKSWLLNSVSKKIYTSILYFQTAYEIWKDLHTRFHKSNLPRLYKLRQQIHSMRQGTMDLSSYHTQTQSLWEELSSLQVTARSVEDLLAERETNRVIDFLMGLNDSYDTVRSQILMKKTLPTLSEVYNMLDNDDTQRSARSSSITGLDSSAFQVSQQSSGQQIQSHGDNQVQRKDRPVCTFCGKVGHIMDRCYKKHGYPVSFGPKRFSKPSQGVAANVMIENSTERNANVDQNSASVVHEELSTEQMQQIVSFLSSKIQSPCSISKPEVHAVSVSSLPSSSSTNGPAPGSYSGINDWNG